MNKTLLNDAMLQEAGRLFCVLSDSSRLKLLRLLMDAPKPLSQGALAEASGLSQANTSKHLICLVQAGLVAREREGNMAYFRLAGPLVVDVCGLVKGHILNRTQTAYQSLR